MKKQPTIQKVYYRAKLLRLAAKVFVVFGLLLRTANQVCANTNFISPPSISL